MKKVNPLNRKELKINYGGPIANCACIMFNFTAQFYQNWA